VRTWVCPGARALRESGNEEALALFGAGPVPDPYAASIMRRAPLFARSPAGEPYRRGPPPGGGGRLGQIAVTSSVAIPGDVVDGDVDAAQLGSG
jgi:hypothetical protein